jgi:hypothetical protein
MRLAFDHAGSGYDKKRGVRAGPDVTDGEVLQRIRQMATPFQREETAYAGSCRFSTLNSHEAPGSGNSRSGEAVGTGSRQDAAPSVLLTQIERRSIFELSDKLKEHPMDATFIIFKKTPAPGSPVWIETVEGLEKGKKRLSDYRSRSTDDYYLFDVKQARVVDIFLAKAKTAG